MQRRRGGFGLGSNLRNRKGKRLGKRQRGISLPRVVETAAGTSGGGRNQRLDVGCLELGSAVPAPIGRMVDTKTKRRSRGAQKRRRMQDRSSGGGAMQRRRGAAASLFWSRERERDAAEGEERRRWVVLGFS